MERVFASRIRTPGSAQRSLTWLLLERVVPWILEGPACGQLIVETPSAERLVFRARARVLRHSCRFTTRNCCGDCWRPMTSDLPNRSWLESSRPQTSGRYCNCLVSIRRRPQAEQSPAEQSRIFLVELDKLDEVFNSAVGKCHYAVFSNVVDPGDTVLGIHFVGDAVQPVFVFAEVLSDTGDGGDVMNLVDVHGYAA
jgi:hypothetical protein